MKKVPLLLLVIGIVLLNVPSYQYINGSTNKYEEEARVLYDMNLFNGVSATSFVPDLGSISTREQAMKIIAVALQWELNMNERSPFNDVSEWAQPYVAKAYSLGITLGISKTEFGGSDIITRRQLGTWMLRALGYEPSQAWENTLQLSSSIGSTINEGNKNEVIYRDGLVGMLFSFLKEGTVLTRNQTLIQEYVSKYPEYAALAKTKGMIDSNTGNQNGELTNAEFVLIENVDRQWDAQKMMMKTQYRYERALLTSNGELMSLRDLGMKRDDGTYITEYSYVDKRIYYIKDVTISVDLLNNQVVGDRESVYNDGNQITYTIVHTNNHFNASGSISDDRGMLLYYIQSIELITSVDPPKTAVTIGLAADLGGISENSFSKMTWLGVERFIKEFGLDREDYLIKEVDSNGDYTSAVNSLISANKKIIIAPGFMFQEAVETLAGQYPNQKFLILDSTVDEPNVVSVVFKEEEGSFLVGLAAGLKAKEQGISKVGFIGGVDFELIQKFEAGFEAGVHEIDPNICVLVEYAGTFADANVGKSIANKLYGQGANIIYIAAGGTGMGVIEEAKEQVSNNKIAWVIGVDTDQYSDGIYSSGKSVILTSMLKRLDNVAYDICKSLDEETFVGGVFQYGLAENGVDLPVDNPNLITEWMLQIESYKEKVVSGEIQVPTVPSRLK